MIDPRKKKSGLTSEEAAALYLSDGRTTDVEAASQIDRGTELNMDALQRAHIRRQMGFDFKVKQAPNYLHVYATDGSELSSRAKLYADDVDAHGNIINEEAITRLVDACMRLKKKWNDKNGGSAEVKVHAA